MSRSVIAFAVAPLWVPLVVAPCAFFFMFPQPEQRTGVVVATIVSAIFGYGGTLLLGLPAFVFFRRRNLTAPWLAIVLGFVAGAVMWAVFLVFFALWLQEGRQGVTDAIWDTVTNPSRLTSFLAPGSIGAAVGITLWLIARPDFKK